MNQTIDDIVLEESEVTQDQQAELAKRLEEMTPEQREALNGIIEKYRQKIAASNPYALKKVEWKPKSFYTKKGPGRGKKPKKR